ncbi:hypothetical protein AVEN_135669-1 [Araneus ventricosus]|uniref:Uncharacterized protein n=1 Tax=Araneus ventricosus TaxID=182803 RepID=A0A4Y2QRT6_ARAVE|nr:hypothetical protein AVEN_135669-1 [Araneus ventricosus]
MGCCGLVIMSRYEADGRNPIPLKDLSLNVTLRDKSPPAEAVRKLWCQLRWVSAPVGAPSSSSNLGSDSRGPYKSSSRVTYK